jgi:DnaJ domain
MNLKDSLQWFELVSVDELTLDVLKKGYHRLAQKYHPDRGGSSDDFIKLREAYTFLQDYLANPYRDDGEQTNSTQDLDQVLRDLERYKVAFAHSQGKIHGYESMITKQIDLISSFQTNLQNGISRGKQSEDELRVILDNELTKLKKKYDSGWWKQSLGIRSMSEQEYTEHYNALIDEYNSLRRKQDDQYIENLLALYRGLVNQIIDLINTV